MINTEPALTESTADVREVDQVGIADGHPGSLPAKIQPHHLDRLAVVYVRQSTPQQVLEHRESTALQYNLRTRAIHWGWPRERVLVIDEDQGRSGQSADGRTGFQRLLVEVSLDHVGLILGLEMSRLARSCKDWHQLLEVCALFGTLLADHDGIYDPRDYNDRLLLGLKGTLSEAELHLLRQRMHQGILNKAKRGELFNLAPIGYLRSPTGQFMLDPDEQVQAMIHLVFDTFDEAGTVSGVLRFLVQQKLQLPFRSHTGADRGQLQWRRPTRQRLRTLLHHPIYAGAYTWGRKRIDPRRKVPGKPGSGRTVVPAEQCTVLLKDRCPAYIAWARYDANRRRMAENQNRCDRQGAPREGSALLKGLLVCGRCQCRMVVQYDRLYKGRGPNLNHPRYACTHNGTEYGESLCQSLTGRVLDEFVAQQALTVLQPASLALSLSAAEDIEQQRMKIDGHWRHRVERARYDVDRARRQYEAVEPENRLVVRELERQWEQKLLDLRGLEEQYERFGQKQATVLTDDERRQIHELSCDIPKLWHAPQTTTVDRQTIVRHLIERGIVTAPPDSQHVDVTIQWAGNFVSQHTLIRPVGRYEQLDNYQQLLDRILELHDQKKSSARIAEQLNVDGFLPPKRRSTFNAPMVRKLIWHHRRSVKRSVATQQHELADHEWWFVDFTRHLDLPYPTLYSWVRRGWVHARQLPVNGGRWVIWADADEVDRLKRLRRCPKSWHNLHQAAELTQPKPRPGT